MTPRILSLLTFVLAIGAGWFFLFGMKAQGNRDRRAAQKVTAPLKEALAEKNLTLGSPVFIRAFKQEKELEVWVQEKGKDTFTHLRTYPIAAASGNLGPKLAEGDKQVPEGFYFVPPSQMNPNSRYHLAFNIGYPNAYDRAHGRTGSFIMIHGSVYSIGCLAMTDSKIEEIYTLCDAAHKNGQKFFRVHIFPFRMTDQNMALHQNSKWLPFWKNIRQGYQWFEQKKTPPNANVIDKKYHFAE